MNLPNKLTVLRILMVPFFVFFMLANDSIAFRVIALVLFCVASLTDWLDGKIARSRGLVTTFGKLMDPLADKILVMSAMICFIPIGYAPSWVVIVILAREFLVTSLRLVAAGEGKVIAADKWGKIKTVMQMAWIISVLLWTSLENSTLLWGAPLELAFFAVQGIIVLMLASVVFSLLSAVNYCWQNRDLLLKDM